jgi:hypothetical protein
LDKRKLVLTGAINLLDAEKAPDSKHPWMKFAGIFKDDPTFDEVQAYIEQYRRELDAEIEEYYRKLDAEEEQGNMERVGMHVP